MRRRPVLFRGPTPSLRPCQGRWTPSIPRASARTGPNRFRLLNQEREIRTWNDRGIPELWLYNLHYHECPDLSLIESWLAENPVHAAGTGWEPYPLSLRIVNWVKWLLNGNALPQVALESLAIQAAHLESVLEYDILANHLLANAKALVFAGTIFQGGIAEKWLRNGLDIFERQIPEQILPDAAHFERSPMYHSLCAEDLLDLTNLGEAYPGLLPNWRETAARMLGWLRTALHPDGRIAFFNDSTFGAAPEPDAIFAYGTRLGISETVPISRDSGYIRLENGPTLVLFDAAPIGPDYQPEHAHADTLSFELSHRGRRVLVNSGTSNYEMGPRRQWERGTAAHNTVRVDGQDSSEVWKTFRVARRAYPIQVKTDGRSYAEAAHDGYRRLRPPVIHRRRLELLPHLLTVTDSIEGLGNHEVEVFFHVHPDAEVEIDLDPNLTKIVEKTTYHPGFNLSTPKNTVVGRYRGPCPAVFTSRVALA